MSVTELEEIRKSVKALEKKSLKEFANLLRQVGNYYRLTIPSEIDLEYVKETERLLNNLYIRTTEVSTPSEIQTSLKKTLGIASSISYAVKVRRFGPKTFALSKDLSEALIAISSSVARIR